MNLLLASRTLCFCLADRFSGSLPVLKYCSSGAVLGSVFCAIFIRLGLRQVTKLTVSGMLRDRTSVKNETEVVTSVLYLDQ